MSHKYRKFLYFITVLLLFSSVGSQAMAQGISTIGRDTTVIFQCNKAVPIDLFKAMDVGISFNNGYWGDVEGAPLDYGNIFDPRKFGTQPIDTMFYFYITSPTTYCGLKSGQQLQLHLNVDYVSCEAPDGLLLNYFFCKDTDMAVLGQGIPSMKIDPMTIQELIFATAKNPKAWMKDSTATPHVWMDIKLYTDSILTDPITDMNFTTAEPKSDTMWVVVVGVDGKDMAPQRIIKKVHQPSALTITYSPDIKQLGMEYDVNDDITISVNEADNFEIFEFYMNNKYLNKYFLGGNNTESSITLNALTFSGADDLIRITARDSNTCATTIEDNVVVNVPLPNVFTPDGDGVNDIFFGGEKFANREFHLEIFNRWGNRLYFGESGWDGTYKGNDVPPGTYFYVIMLKAPDGTTRTVKGHVTLIRKRM